MNILGRMLLRLVMAYITIGILILMLSCGAARSLEDVYGGYQRGCGVCHNVYPQCWPCKAQAWDTS
jgi:hypothetical protein